MLKTVTKNITLEDMALYAGANNYHGSDEAARAAGLPSAIVQGGQLGGYLHEMMVANFGYAFLVSGDISIAFLKTVKAGDTLKSAGEIVGESEVDGKPCVELDIWLENQDGQKVVAARARSARTV